MDKAAILVLGAAGGIGGAVARQARDAGWTVRGMTRGPSAPPEQRDGITWIRGDALIRGDVVSAAEGCTVIVHAVNPAGYRRWSELVLPMLDNSIAAASPEAATVVLPGTVYNYGPDAFPTLTEQSPQHPVTRKGAIRAEMERRLEAFSQQGGRVLIVRAGDFFGPSAGNSWFSQGLVRPGRPVSRVNNPSQYGIGHQWSYLPDVASIMMKLLEQRHSLERFSTFHTAGNWDQDGTEMAAAIRRVVLARTGREPQLAAFPWWLLRLASPFVPTFRELREMRYLWEQPIRMANSKLTAVIGPEPHTPLDQAVEATLLGLGCIESTRATTNIVSGQTLKAKSERDGTAADVE
jgi:nucleoside-diphosphate-sugar epimerase